MLELLAVSTREHCQGTLRQIERVQVLPDLSNYTFIYRNKNQLLSLIEHDSGKTEQFPIT